MNADDQPHPDAADAMARRVEAAASAFHHDPAAARRHLADPDAKVRAAAIGALVKLGAAGSDEVTAAMHDADAGVRRRICELAADLSTTDFSPLLDDSDPSVVEAAAFALGETGNRAALDRLSDVATGHADPLCREAAVAALGAIGDPRAKAAVLAGLADVPAVRRRAVVALAAFDGADVDAALSSHIADRDWQTRQAAAEILGVSESEPR